MPPKPLPAPSPAAHSGATGGAPAILPPQADGPLIPHVELPPAVVQGPGHLSPPLALPQPPAWPAINREDFELLEENERAEFWAQLVEAQKKTAAYLTTVDARQQLQQQQQQQQQRLAQQLEEQDQLLRRMAMAQQQQQQQQQYQSARTHARSTLVNVAQKEDLVV